MNGAQLGVTAPAPARLDIGGWGACPVLIRIADENDAAFFSGLWDERRSDLLRLLPGLTPNEAPHPFRSPRMADTSLARSATMSVAIDCAPRSVTRT